jgi:cysteine synthase
MLVLMTSLLVGIGQGRITDNLGTFVKQVDGAFTVDDTKSIAMLYEMLDTEGLYLGASSALNVVAAYELAQKLGKGMCSWYFGAGRETDSRRQDPQL